MVPLVEHSLFPEHVTKRDKMHHSHMNWPCYSRGRDDGSLCRHWDTNSHLVYEGHRKGEHAETFGI